MRAFIRVSVLSLMVITMAGISFGQQSTRVVVDRITKRVSITAQPGQIISAPIEPRSRGGIILINPSDQTGDADFSAFNTEGVEIGRETLELKAGTKLKVSVLDIFPDLNIEELSSVLLQVSVREAQDDNSLSDNQFASQSVSPSAVQLAVAFFSQLDPRWSSNKLGTCSGTTIKSAGCAITAIAMAGARSVYNMNPASLNTYLTNNGGYSGGCSVIWANAALVDGRYGFLYIGSGTVKSAANLKSYIDSSRFPVAKSARYSSHYVTIIGYKNQGANLSDFYYLDPADSNAVFRYVGDGWVSSSSSVQIYQ